MLTTSVAELVRLFVSALLLGAAFAAAYDLLRITRVLMGVRYAGRMASRLDALPMPRIGRSEHRHHPGHTVRDLLVNVEDLLYFLTAGPVIAIFLSAANHGRVRWLAFAGILLGFSFYRLTFGRLVIGCSAAIAAVLRFLVAWLFWAICQPFGWLFRLTRRAGARIAHRVRKLWLRIYLPGYTRRATRRYLRQLGRVFSESDLGGCT